MDKNKEKAGIAQIIGAKAVDRIAPVRLINLALVGTAIILFVMPLCNGFLPMLIMWSIAGLVQFAIWPAVMRIIAEYLLPKHKNRAMVYIAFAYCFGMMLS